MSADVRLCRTAGLDPDLWFKWPGSAESVVAARHCFVCPVRDECRDYARAEGIPDGIWGGEDRDERERWWRDNGGRPDTFLRVIDDAVRPLLQERRDYESELSA